MTELVSIDPRRGKIMSGLMRGYRQKKKKKTNVQGQFLYANCYLPLEKTREIKYPENNGWFTRTDQAFVCMFPGYTAVAKKCKIKGKKLTF